MTKNEIKAALDLHGIGYKAKIKLADLVKLYNAHCVGEEGPYLDEKGNPEAVAEVDTGETETTTEFLEREWIESNYSYDEALERNCPGCGIHLSNGLLTADDEVVNKAGVTLHMEGMNRAYECMGCGHQFGAHLDPYVAPAGNSVSTGIKIEKDRPEQNGIKRPSAGGKCRAIWDALDEYLDEMGEQPTAKVVRMIAGEMGWNPNNASIEFYQWRKFHGYGKAK